MHEPDLSKACHSTMVEDRQNLIIVIIGQKDRLGTIITLLDPESTLVQNHRPGHRQEEGVK